MILRSIFRYDHLFKIAHTDVYDPVLADELLEFFDNTIPDPKYQDHWDNEISHHYTQSDGSYIFMCVFQSGINVVLVSGNSYVGMFASLTVYFELPKD